MFKSHLISMIVFASIVSVMLAVLKFDTKKEMIHYGVKLFCMMVFGVIAGSWLMNLV